MSNASYKTLSALPWLTVHAVRFCQLAGLALAMTVSSVEAGEGDWDQWRGPQRDGAWQGNLPETLDELALAWEKSLGPSYSGPVTNGQAVFTTETVDESLERVTAFNMETGAVLWESEWDGAIVVPPYAAENGSCIKSTPALGSGSLVVLGMRDELVCLDQTSGEQRWKVDLADRFAARRQTFGGVCSPLIDGDAVYVMGGGGTVKLAIDDGSTVWRTLADEGEDDDALSSPIIASIAGIRQLVVQTRTRLCGVELEKGSVLWQVPIQAYRNMNILTPTVIGDRVFMAAHTGRSQCFAVTFAEGSWTVEEVWNQKTQGYMSSPVADAQTIYLHSKAERLTALDVETGAIRWTSKPVGKYQSLVRNRHAILGLSSRGELLLVKADPQNLVIQSTRQVADDSWGYLGVFDGGLLVRDLTSLKVFRY
ncbi:PQQ-binding-like beta-propeller repeat protein [Bythopirellula goksoeyrii]|uniref:Outer membrane biogenesis protein BamB n=1 Tax=Bythopirellula goksoeyrii TaxID=1400387 RepID=A0A5B9QAT0_9BACT|nr:PQQ-binding-like beta-propeller repeat protein [Bythopirellula goksoeyrii]QEG36117.1 outer membrane biogenesis protein BamB [Bythopirellula goksoeyrii]